MESMDVKFRDKIGILGTRLLEIVAESSREIEKGQWKGGQLDKEVSRRRK